MIGKFLNIFKKNEKINTDNIAPEEKITAAGGKVEVI